MKDKGGYGVVYQDVTRNRNLSAAAKGLYAYLSSFCGTTDECYPSVETIIKEMDMGKDTFYRHINALVAAGVVEKHQTLNNGKFGRTIYRLTHEVTILDYPITQNEETEKTFFPITDNMEADNSTTDSKETNNNNILNNNIINNNNISVCPEPDKPAAEPGGVLLPLNDNSFYDVPQDKINLWVQVYQAVDVMQELQKMRAWLDSNPTRRKTRRGISRFINSWLSREQDSGKGNLQNSRQGSQNCHNNSFNSFRQNDYDIDDLEKKILSN